MPTKTVVEGSVEAALAAYNEGKVDALDEFYAPDFVRHVPPFPDTVGLEAYKKYISNVRGSYPGAHLTIDKWLCEGDLSASRGTWQGTKAGESVLTTAGGTGQKLKFDWCSMVRWEGDKVVEEWVGQDNLTMVAQLGLIPPLKELFKGGG
jgi:predicted ester cyclase